MNYANEHGTGTLDNNFTHFLNPDNNQCVPKKSRKEKVLDSKYICDECDYIGKTKYKIERHLLVHKKERPYKCDKCSFSTKTENYLKNHQNVHEGMASLSCEKCSFKTTTMLYLRRHYKRTHMEIKENNTNAADNKFKCDGCDKSFKYQSRLKEHQVSHSDVRPFKCTKCDFSAKSKLGLNNHQLVHKDMSEVPTFACSKCDYVTKYRYAFRDHKLTHVDISELNISFRCNMCTYVGKTKWLLKKHEIVHKNFFEVATYRCESCEFVTKYKGAIVKHVRKHNLRTKLQSNSSGEIKNDGYRLRKRLKCDRCKFTAKYKRTIDRHQAKHIEEKSHPCNKCPFKAKTKFDLKRHRIVVHGKSKLFPCNQCPYVANLPMYLRLHQKGHQNHVMIKCDKCYFPTSRIAYLKKHYMRVHNEALPTNYITTNNRLDYKQKVLPKFTMIKCDKCDYTTIRIAYLETHYWRVHKAMLPPNFYSIISVEDQRKLQGIIRIVKCDRCYFVTTRISYLEGHYMRIHNDILPNTYCNSKDEYVNSSDIPTNQSCGLMRDSNDHIESSIDHSCGNFCTDIKVEDNLISSINIERDAFDEYCNKNSESILSSRDQSNLLEVGDHENICGSVTNLDIKNECVDTNEEDLTASLNTNKITTIKTEPPDDRI